MNGTASNHINIGANLIIFAFGTFVADLKYEQYNDNLPKSIVKYHQLSTRSWESQPALSESVDVENFNAIRSFSENLLNNTKDLDSEIMDVVNKNFWDLI